MQKSQSLIFNSHTTNTMAYEEKKEGEPVLPHQQCAQLISTFPSCEGWVSPLLNYHGFWYPELFLPGVIAFRHHFKPRDTDIFLASAPKSGTTWLMALAFATVSRRDHNPIDQNHPLTNTNPHDCVPFLDRFFCMGQASALGNLPSPRLLYCHLAYSLLPESVTSSDCRIIYICRDPKDTFVSMWYYYNGLRLGAEPLPFDKAFQMFCKGMSPFGLVWEHYLGYWRESLRRPAKILFLKYEEMVEDPVGNLKKLAEFIGHTFSQEEEKQGIVEGIVRLCSFEKLSSSGGGYQRCSWSEVEIVIKNSSYFRKGKVGDWKNHLTPEMAQRLDAITEEKLHGSGLRFGSVE